MTETQPVKTGYLLETQQVFSKSLLWDLQQQYFTQMGVEAWRQGEVPHYVTSNPTIANSYAEVVFAFWRDQQRLVPSTEPLYICELGAGSGRFAFHFLSQLTRLCQQANVDPLVFRYILTDVAESNLKFWRGHPRFQSFFASGLLDLAQFDINDSEQLNLQCSDQVLSVECLEQPLVVIANYVFDSVPQELYAIQAGQYFQCLVSLLVEEDPNTLNVAELLSKLRIRYDYQPLAELPHPELYLQSLLTHYQQSLTNTNLLFPAIGLRCLERLRALSRQGLLVLSADKGGHELDALEGCPPPGIVRHGSFSLSVNYHAFKVFCEQSGGLALFPEHYYEHVNVACLLMLEQPQNYIETRRAYQRQVMEFGPDDFYTVFNHMQRSVKEMPVTEILAYLRLSRYDSHQFGRYFLPRLLELAPDVSAQERRVIRDAIDKVWALYFPLGEEFDLAHQTARLLYELDEYGQAVQYFERSLEIYGPYCGTLYNMAVCYRLLGQHQQAEGLLKDVLTYDPDNQDARTLLAGYENAV
jgi:tetratricopeptide (TPR) repeat protein